MLEAFVTNLGKYNEGHLIGEWLPFPTTKDQVQELLSRIGVDGVSYQEYKITDYKVGIFGLVGLNEDTDIDELNYFASLLNDMSFDGIDSFEAAAVHGQRSGNMKDLINLAQNPDCYEYAPGTTSHEELGRFLIDVLEREKIPSWIEPYFDYEAYGQDYAHNKGGVFVDTGFVYRNDAPFIEHYDGQHVPEAYRVFAYPDPLERRNDLDNQMNAPLLDNEHVQSLLKILQDNDKTQDAQNLMAVVNQVGAMEKQLAAAVEELKTMRGELNAMHRDHPLRNALQNAVRTMSNTVAALREQLATLKQSVIDGCRNAVSAFKEKGISALAHLADFFKLRPALEAIGRNTDEAIRADDQAIAKIETASVEVHETGLHFKNIFRSMAGKEPLTEAKPAGMIAKAIAAPYKAERRALRGLRKGVNAALSGLAKLEQARPIKEQFADAAKEAAAANAVLSAPGRTRAAQVDR